MLSCNMQVTKVLQFIYEFADDKNAWRTFASCLKTCSLGFARKGFSIIFDRFPFSGSFVKMYCEMEEAAKNYEIVIEVFVFCLYHVDFKETPSVLC